MKRQTFLKSTLCLLMALVCNVAWANFTQQWTQNPVAPWGTTNLTEGQYPAEVGANLITAQGSKTGTVRKAETDVCALADGTVTLVFNYVNGGHKLNILGVDLVGADGQVKASDYHYGKAPGDGTTKTYTLTGVVAGDYTLRYFVCNNSSDGDQLSMTNGNIVVTGLDLNRLKYNIGDGKYNDRSGSDWRSGWTSTNAAKPSFTISANGNVNNMNAASTEYIGMRPGQSGSSTYTLTLGEYFLSYSFEAKSTNAGANHKITINGEQTAVGTEWTTFNVDVYGTTTSFVLSGGNSDDFYIRNIKFVQEVPVASAAEFMNGGVYTFVTARGKMGATESNAKVISTARTSVSDANTDFFKWTVYKSNNGNYYLYNVGKQQFMGVQSANNTEIDFVATPAGKKLTFKQSGSTDYPIMFSTDNNGVVNHSTNHGGGLINWTGGWSELNDGGSNHKVTLVSRLPEATLQEIAAKVEAYDKRLYVKAEVEGSWEDNPNTHFGSVRATASTGTLTSKLKTTPSVATVDYDGLNETTIDFTRDYRGFEFQGYSFGGVDLGKSFTLTDEQKASITAENPLVAKFIATEDVTLFYDDDVKSYRIPAIGKTSTGRLIAVSDYRHNLDDIGMDRGGTGSHRIDLVIRMSDDNGKTWSPKQTIAEGTDNRGADDCAFGDAAIAVVGQKVLVMAAAGDVIFANGTADAHNRTWRVYSEDNGVTWAKEDISTKLFIGANATIPNGYTAFFGSGKLAVDENFNGTGNARIYGAMLIKNASGTYNNFVIYTDNFGADWKILGGSTSPIANQDEPKVEILPSGQILFSVRRGGGRQFNVFTYGTGENDKANGVGTWNGNVNGCDNEGSNSTNGEIYCIDAKNASGDDVKLLLQSQPVGGGTWDRENVSIWYKEITDAAYTSAEIAAGWTKGIQVSHQLSAYSTMVLQEDGRIAFFFEEAPCYNDNYVRGYCMVYAPLTIEQITKNKYFSLDFDFDTEREFSVVLTDAQGNEYRDQVTSSFGDIATNLTAKYPFITLGDTPNLESDGENFTYTNTVTLPFKVSNEETTVWHNIYFHTNGNSEYMYFYAGEANASLVGKKNGGGDTAYGNSQWNTAEHADNMCWAVYHAGNFTFNFKNKLTGKFIQVTSVASGSAENVKFVEEDATAFEIVKDVNNSWKGDYSLKASVGNTVGYLGNTSSSYAYATHYNGNGHQGGWVTFVEAPDFATLIDEVNGVLDAFGTSLGQYAATDAVTAAKTAMQSSNTVKLNTLNSYKTLLNGATLNMPVNGQYIRVAYDYGNAGKLYMQSTASSVRGLEFTEATGAASIWVYYDGALYSYTAGQCLRETGDDRGLQAVGGKTTATFRASSRAKGKYTLQCGSYVHANTNNNGKYYTDHCGSDGCAQHDLILEEVDELPVSISSVGYGTLYARVALEIPEHVKAYTGSLNEDNTLLTLTKITSGIIPARTGVVLYRDGDSYAEGAPTGTTAHDFVITTTTETVENNAFEGSVATIARTSVVGEAYTLQLDTKSEIGVAFKTSAANVASGKAYLVLPSQESAKALRIRFAGEGTTSIDNEQLIIDNAAIEVYDLAGRRVENPTKGIYIVNGKKVVVK